MFGIKMVIYKEKEMITIQNLGGELERLLPMSKFIDCYMQNPPTFPAVGSYLRQTDL